MNATANLSAEDAALAQAAERARRRSRWLKTLLQWHWISSAISLAGLLLFALTGLTLNHAGKIESHPATVHREARLPADLQALLKREATAKPAAVPPALRDWTARELRIELPADAAAEWSNGEFYVPLPRAGGDAWLRVGLDDGALEYENTDRGWIAYLNDLHKGRHTGLAWSWFIDAFALACSVFALTGLLILKLHAANRPSTWPMVGLGLVLPLLLALLFIH